MPSRGHAARRLCAGACGLGLLSASAGAVSFEQFSALLRSPELQADAAEASAAARLDVALRSRAPSEAPLEDVARARGARGARRVDRSGRRLAASADRPRRSADLRGNHPMSRWVSLWISRLRSRSVALAPSLVEHRVSISRSDFANCWRHSRPAIPCSARIRARRRRESCGVPRAIRRFKSQTGIPPIWVSGQLIDPWLSYEGLWITGCDEERWPPPVDPIPLLPMQLQRQYGVIAAAVHSQLQFAEDLQQRWQARADECVFSCADPGDGRRRAPSPLLRSLQRARQPLTCRSRRTCRSRSRIGSRCCNRAPALEQLIDEMAPPFGADERTRGVSTLKAQSRCAFRGFAQTRLMADPLERPVPGFNERERGELLHDALAAIWSEVRDSARLSALLSASRAARVVCWMRARCGPSKNCAGGATPVHAGAIASGSACMAC